MICLQMCKEKVNFCLELTSRLFAFDLILKPHEILLQETEKSYEITVDLPGVELKGTHRFFVCFMSIAQVSFKFKKLIISYSCVDIKVELEDGVLTISGTKESVNKNGNRCRCSLIRINFVTFCMFIENDKIHTSERFYGSFSRSWTINPETTDDDISANFKNGVLQVTLHKKESAQKKATKKVEVKVDETK